MPVSHDLDYKQNRLIYLCTYTPTLSLIQRGCHAILTAREMSLRGIQSDFDIQFIFHTNPAISDKEILVRVWMSSYGWMDGWTRRYMDGDDNGNVLGLCWPVGAVIRGGVSLIRWGTDPPLLACDITVTLVLFLTNVDTHSPNPPMYKDTCAYIKYTITLYTLCDLSVLILKTKCLEETFTDKQ